MGGQFGLVRRGCCGSQEERPFPAVGHLNRPIKNIKKVTNTIENNVSTLGK